ncbi:MAG: methionyl-tRNA formyltransferase [Fusobacteriaceae bacterium]
MKIIFMGTPEFAISSLKNIYEKYGVEAIFTKVDKPNMRGGKIKFTPVKEFAMEKNIKLFQPQTLKSDEIIREIKKIEPDLIVVVAYGKIIPKEIIDIPKYGIINVHSSLLPKYRGAAPINAAIVAGEKESGVTIMKLVEQLDAGDIIEVAKTNISEDDNFSKLHDRLKEIGAQTLMVAMEKIFAGTAKYVAQDESKVSFVKPYKKEDLKINWNDTAENIHNFVRGLNPFPGVFTHIDEKLLKIIECKKNIKASSEYENFERANFGEIIGIEKSLGFVVKVKDGSIILTKIKPENKSTLSGVDSINGKHLKVGDRLI